MSYSTCGGDVVALHLIPASGHAGLHSPTACCPCWPDKTTGRRADGTYGVTYTHHTSTTPATSANTTEGATDAAAGP